MLKVRKHRGGYEDSMATAAEIEPTVAALIAYFFAADTPLSVLRKYRKTLKVDPYYGVDSRNGWNTYIVTLPNHGVLGFTDGPLGET